MKRNQLINLFSANKGRGGAPKAALKAEGNVIYLYDFIAGSEDEAQYWGGISAEGLANKLQGMTGDVQLRIDSPGGDVFGGRAMAQAIREYSGKVVAHVDGLAASAASYVAIACDEVRMAEGSFFMIHKAWTLAMGNADDFRKDADLLDKIDASIAQSYAAKSGGDHDWLAMMASESWFDAQEAIDIGLADILSTSQKAQNRKDWDLSAYANAPKIEPTPPEMDAVEQAAQDLAARKRQLAVDLLPQAA